MQITCDSNSFLAAFNLASAVAPARSPKPILRNVRMEVSGEGLCTLMATDLEIGVRVEVSGVEVGQPGDVLLPVDRFGQILRESKDAKLTIESDEGKVLVRSNYSSFKLPSADAAEYPSVAGFEGEQYHTIPARTLVELIRRTAFAADTDSARYALGGVMLELNENEALAVATDGRRLATVGAAANSVNGHNTDGKTVIVPIRAVKLIERALADCECDVQILARNNDVLVKAGGVTIFSRLVEGRFPKWRDVFPRLPGYVKLELPVEPFHAAVRQAAIVTSDESRGVDFKFGDGKVILSAKSAESGLSRVELPIAYDGPWLDITLDPRYFGDFLKAVSSGTFSLEVLNEESAAVCSTDDGYRYVIMPLARDKK